jgi:hypothetical protein
VHAPDGHVSAAFARSHTTPHAPQSPSVARLASHPVDASPSQSPNPAAHACRLHAPLKHVAVAWLNVHAFAHAPQFVTLPFRFVSHPFAAFRSQSPNPAVHATPHALPVQLGVPFDELHTRPHDPQFSSSSDVRTSHPVAYDRSQFANPALHAWIAHAVPRHVGVPFCAEQTVPHPPQLLALFVVAVSHPLLTFASQLPNPAAHVMLHAPAMQNANPFVVSHPSPHPPQCFALVSVFASHPFDASPSQSANGGRHDAISHFPVAHVVFAFGSTHTCPHDPQFSGVDSSASHPSW